VSLKHGCFIFVQNDNAAIKLAKTSNPPHAITTMNQFAAKRCQCKRFGRVSRFRPVGTWRHSEA